MGPELNATGLTDTGPKSEFLSVQISRWGLVWIRLKRHRMAMAGASILLVIVGLSLIGPFVSPPFVQVDHFGNFPLWAIQRANHPPQLAWPYLLGTGPNGNYMVSYLLRGGTPLLAIGILGALFASLLGVLIGSVAGYAGRVVDAFLMRVTDAFLSVPFLLLLVLLSRYLVDRSAFMYAVLFGLAGWPSVARLVRGYVLSLREREFAVASRALGSSSRGVITRHLLPNALDVVIVSCTLNVAIFLMTEVTLDFLNAGTADVTWGTPLSAAFSGMMEGAWWLFVFPCLAILLTVQAINFLGDGLRDALDTTSPTVLTARGTPSAEPGGAGRFLIAVVKQLGGMAAAGERLTKPVRTASYRVLAYGGLPTVDQAAPQTRNSAAGRAPLPLLVVPPVLIYLLVGGILLYRHSPLDYAPNYAAPTHSLSLAGQEPYGLVVRRDGSLDVFTVTSESRLVYLHLGSGGHVLSRQGIAPGGSGTMPTLGTSQGEKLGAWVGAQGESVYAARLGGSPLQPIRLNPPGGTVTHPFVVALPRGGLDVLFAWQRPGSDTNALYLAALDSRRSRLVQLVGSGDVLEPRAVVDGAGAMDVIYLFHSDPQHGYWQVRFQRFTSLGRPLHSPVVLGLVSFVQKVGDFSNPNIVPLQWAVDVKPAADGSVWGTWEDGNDIVQPDHSIQGNNPLFLAHWSRRGVIILPPRQIASMVDPNGEAVTLAVQSRHTIVYFPAPGPVEPYLQSETVSDHGRTLGSERVSYDAGGGTANPSAQTVNGRLSVTWERVGSETALEWTVWRPSRAPNLLIHLGLNIGVLWVNLGLLVFGSLAAGVVLALVNAYLLVPLIPLWWIFRGLVPAFLWLAFGIATLALLTLLFAIPDAPPAYALVIGGLAGPEGLAAGERWLVIVAGAGSGMWVGRYVLHDQEDALRAAAVGFTALAFVAAMYATLFIQAEIGRI